jgi:proteasome lid subunit RPN8/RPN11
MHDPAHTWASGKDPLRIAEHVLERVDREAFAGYARDEESCGFLTGPAGDPLLVDGIMPMENRANKLHAFDPVTFPRTGRMYFDIDALTFVRKVHAQAELGKPVKVLYHSHLDVGAYFSETDAAAAMMGGHEPPYDLAYFVTSIRGGEGGTRVDDHRLFVWDADSRSFVPGEFVVVPREKAPAR